MAWALERWLAPYIGEGATATPATSDNPVRNRKVASVADVASTGWGDAQEERAAVVEYDGGAPRNWAEALARLDPSKPPSNVSLDRWQRFIDDCGHFLDGGWAARAAAFEWGPLHLFGCDRKRPYYGPHRGLLWEVNGGRLVELHRDRAIIEIKGGSARQSYRRQPVELGRVVFAWELTAPFETARSA